MKPDIFIHSHRKLKRNTLKEIAKSKQSLKNAKNNIKQAIETVIFYNSEIKLQCVRFKNNLNNFDRF